MLEQKFIGKEGNHYIYDYNCKHFEVQDYEKIQGLIDTQKKPLPLRLSHFSHIRCPYEFMEFYSVSSESKKKQIRDFTKKTREKLNKDSPLALPEESLFPEIEKNWALEEMLNSHCRHGGRIGCGNYSSPDNPGWTRVELIM